MNCKLLARRAALRAKQQQRAQQRLPSRTLGGGAGKVATAPFAAGTASLEWRTRTSAEKNEADNKKLQRTLEDYAEIAKERDVQRRRVDNVTRELEMYKGLAALWQNLAKALLKLSSVRALFSMVL